MGNRPHHLKNQWKGIKSIWAAYGIHSLIQANDSVLEVIQQKFLLEQPAQLLKYEIQINQMHNLDCINFSSITEEQVNQMSGIHKMQKT